MILIISEKGDVSTHKVIHWLKYFNAKFIVVFPDNQPVDWKISIKDNTSDVYFKLNNKKYSIKDFKKRWYRRGQLPRFVLNHDANDPKSIYTFNELSKLGEFLMWKFNSIPGINEIGYGNVNKLKSLWMARDIGLNIPETIICNQREDILNFNYSIISKGIYGESFHIGNNSYFHGTKLLDIQDVPSQFNYSLFQENVQKEFEIRVFILNNYLYSMAIFSQEHSESKLDWRLGNSISSRIRKSPYQLPIEIQNKLHLLMKSLGLNSGSIDLIKTPNNDFIFLEINPVGQYDFISLFCNINLDEIIALELINSMV